LGREGGSDLGRSDLLPSRSPASPPPSTPPAPMTRLLNSTGSSQHANEDINGSSFVSTGSRSRSCFAVLMMCWAMANKCRERGTMELGSRRDKLCRVVGSKPSIITVVTRSEKILVTKETGFGWLFADASYCARHPDRKAVGKSSTWGPEAPAGLFSNIQ